MLISVVIPCYYSQDSIGDVTERILETFKKDGRYQAQIVLVNDNPKDETWQVIEDLADAHPEVTGISMMKNSGQHSALLAGYRQARGEITVAMDDDGQTPPEEIFKLVDAIDDSTDVVFADYPDEKFANGFRAFGSSLNDLMARWLLGKPKDLYLSSYVAARKGVVDEIIRYTGPYPYVDGLMLRTTPRIKNVDVKHEQRSQGTSGYSFFKLLRLWMNGFTAFSVLPLRLCALFGLLCFVVGGVAACFIVVQKLVLHMDYSAGWPSIMCMLLVMGGLILVSLGLIGEYVGRIYISLNQAPQYVIDEIYAPGSVQQWKRLPKMKPAEQNPQIKPSEIKTRNIPGHKSETIQ